MRFILILTFIFSLLSEVLSQLVVNTAATPAQMVANIVGGGITVSNIQYAGAANASGTFTGGGATNLGLVSGIILSSGNATLAVGPNNTGSAGSSLGTGSDPQLASLIPGYTINDAVSLKFNLIPQSDTIKFRYVFGSEEYPEWVSSSFNDVFGFFITGPNPNGGNYTNRNIAIIPGTNLPVTIDNVNAGSYSQYYVNNSGGATIQYDGFTKVLTAWAKVVPCQTYSLKIAIGDAGDSAFDSAVFIEENSLVASGNNVTVTVGYSNSGVSGNNAIEGCKNGILTFSIPNPMPTPTVVNFTIGGTATNGVDYATLPSTVTIPANQTSTTLTIVPLMDGITEGNETVTINFTNSICGGSTTTTVIIQDNTLLNVTTPPTVAVCNGNPAAFSATASGGQTPYNYQWNNGAGNTQNVSVTPTTTTTYKVTVTDGCGQTATSQVVVNVGTVTANAGNNQIVCLGQSVNLTAYGGINYNWSNSSNTQSINVTPSTTTNYIVTVSDNMGCSATDDVLVTVNPLPPASAGTPQAICIGNQATLNASGGSSYVWAPTQYLSNAQIAAPIASPTVTTTYSVTVTNQNGCSATASVVLTVNPLPPASAGSNTAICLGHSTTLDASGGNSYQWSPATGLSNTAIPNPVANPQVSTTYSVTVTNANTCSAISSMVLTVNTLPPANAGPDNAICIYDAAQLNASGGVSYLWAPSNTLSNPAIQNPNANPLVTTTYTVTVSDAAGCSATDNMVLTVNPLPPANAGIDTTICPNTSAQLFASGGVSYIWSPASGLNNISVASPIAQPALTTTYTVQVTDINGCVQTDNVTVMLFSPPVVTAGPDVAICIGNNTTLNAAGGISYLWNTGDVDATLTVSPQTTSVYTVTVTDAHTCTATDDVNVTVNSLPPANAGADFSICTGDAGQFNATGGVSYVWSPTNGLNNPNIHNPLATPPSETTYTVTVTDANGCSDTDAIVLSIFESPVIDFSPDVFNGCPPLIVHFYDSTTPAIQTWNWNFGDPGSGVFNNSSSQNPVHVFNSTGTYDITLTVTTTDGCTKSLTMNQLIQVYPEPIANFTAVPPVTTIEAPVIQFLNSSLGAVSYYWNFGDPLSPANTSSAFSPYHAFSTDGTFTVMLFVQSAHGCTDSTMGTVRILPEYIIYIPNAFTPNGDGINDIFKPYITNFDTYRMLIYNRWGEMLFETENVHLGWDGSVNNNSITCTMDVYSYVIFVTDFRGETHKYVGRVTLVK